MILTNMCEKQVYLDSVFTVTDPYGQDIKLNGFKTNMAFKFMLILHNLITTNHRKEGKNEQHVSLYFKISNR